MLLLYQNNLQRVRQPGGGTLRVIAPLHWPSILPPKRRPKRRRQTDILFLSGK
jgi:hypothetical protein